ncbi:MAG: DUF1015 domain-containing protein [Ignavibacteriales bacterium]
MVMVAPFRGVRYNPEKIGALDSVLAPPYDVINSEEQNALYEKSPYNVIRIILSKVEGDEKYVQAAETSRKWAKEGILIRDSEPCIYPYYQEFEENGRKITRKGFISAVRLEDFLSKRILPHERTFSGPKLDRLKLTSACNANLSPVFAIYSDPEGNLERAIEEKLSEPLIDAVGGDGARNRLWRISDDDLISKIKSAMLERSLLIADGHHRYETALEFRNIQRKKFGTGSGNWPYEYVMMYLSRAESEGLIIKPTHRVVKNLGSIGIEEFLEKLKGRFNVEKISSEGISALSHQEFAVLIKDSIFKASLKEPGSRSPVHYKNLAVILLHTLVFDGVIDEEEARIFYTKSLEEVFSLVKSGEYKLGFILPPLRAVDVFEFVSSGEKMPHKTTYFYPKLLSGLVFHLLG